MKYLAVDAEEINGGSHTAAGDSSGDTSDKPQCRAHEPTNA